VGSAMGISDCVTAAPLVTADRRAGPGATPEPLCTEQTLGDPFQPDCPGRLDQHHIPGSQFAVQTGARLRGPADASPRRYPILEEGGPVSLLGGSPVVSGGER